MKTNCISRIVGLFVLFFMSICCKKEIDFSKMSEEKQVEFYKKTVESVFEKGDALFQECKSATEFGEHLEDLLSIQGVTDAYVDGNAVYIKTISGSTLSYLYTPGPEFLFDDFDMNSITASTRAGDYPKAWMVGHHNDYKTACFVNQQAKDEGRDYISKVFFPFAKKALENIGISVEIESSPSRDFYKQDMYQYDIIYLITHGSYDSKDDIHWLFTSESLNWIDGMRDEMGESWLGDKIGVSDDIGQVWEVHQGDSVIVKYLMVSDLQIASAGHQFQNKGRAIVFNTACKSLLGNDNLWEAFKQRGAGLYLGYDETNGRGKEAGMYYFCRLASGMSLLNSFYDLPSRLRTEHGTEKDSQGKEREFDAWLRTRYDVDSDISSTFITTSSIPDYEDQSNKEGTVVKLMGHAPMFAPSYLVYDNVNTQQSERRLFDFSYSSFRYGFCISETPVISDSKMLDPLKIGDEGCTYQDYKVSFSSIIENLEPEKKYYYWTYIYDGHDYVFSEGNSFETKRINRVIPEEIIDQMDDYIPIYEGNNPPNVEGQYLLSPSELVYDSTHGFSIGHIFDDLYFQFLNQDMENNTLDYVEEQGNSSQVGTGAFISGEGDRFSVFFNTDGNAVYDDYSFWYKTALVISGIKTADGIKDLDYAFVLVDKGDDPKPYYIPSGSFRVFKDGDGLSTNTNYFSRRTSAPLKPMSYNPTPLPSMFEVEHN